MREKGQNKFRRPILRSFRGEKEIIELGNIKLIISENLPEIRMASPTQWTEIEQVLGDGKGRESLACCSPWGLKKLDMTEQQQQQQGPCVQIERIIEYQQKKNKRPTLKKNYHKIPKGTWLKIQNDF